MTDEEQLLWRELGQPWKLGFGSQLLDRVDVSPEGLVKAAVVSDVLALGGDAVEMEANLGVDKVSVLLDHALGLRLVVGFGVRVPPVLQVALKIKNVSLKFWSYTSSL